MPTEKKVFSLVNESALMAIIETDLTSNSCRQVAELLSKTTDLLVQIEWLITEHGLKYLLMKPDKSEPTLFCQLHVLQRSFEKAADEIEQI